MGEALGVDHLLPDGGVRRAAAHGEVVRLEDGATAVDPSLADDHVGRREVDELRALVLAAPGDRAGLVEAPVVDQAGHALADRQAAAGVLARDALLAAHAPRELLAPAQLLELGLPGHGAPEHTRGRAARRWDDGNMRLVTPAATLLACTALAACGSSSHGPAATVPGAPESGGDEGRPGVVRGAAAGRHGRGGGPLRRAEPRATHPGGPLQTIDTRADAEFFNLSLPCGGRLVKADRRGRYVDALFLLSDRPGSHCDAPGATARAAFLIRAGKIAEWRRVAGEPGDERYERRSPRTGPLV